MAETTDRIFFIPTPRLGHVGDVRPERMTQAQNEWMEHSREILAAKREAAKRGQPVSSEITEDHHFLRPFGGQYCPALQEVATLGWVLKWPGDAVLKNTGPRAWEVHVNETNAFYKYHGMSSFPEAGIADVLSIALGWVVVTPPGWSILVKNLPNNLSGVRHPVLFAEGVIRSDQATVPIQVHALIPANAPKEIAIKRGSPMCVVMPFRREEPLPGVVVEDVDLRDEAIKLATRDQETFANASGRYRELFVDDVNHSPLYPRLLERTGPSKPEEGTS